MSELFLQNEDNLNALIVNFNKLIKSFSILSRDKIENALITANSMMKEGENNIKLMEKEMNKLNLHQQLGKKLNNYKLEFENLQLKFKNSQDKYINQKVNNVINLGNKDENVIDENKRTQLITELSNNLKSEVENNLKTSCSGNENGNNNNSEIMEKVHIQEKLHKENLNNSLPDIDLNIGNKRRNRRLIIILIIIIIFIMVFLIGFLTLYLTKDNKNNRNNNTQ